MTTAFTASAWFRRLETALAFGAGLEIVLLIGPGLLARPALERVAAALTRFGEPVWHRLDREGLEGLLDASAPGLHLVHGFERVPRAKASDLAARLNLNRDRLQAVGAPILVWVPDDFYEELLAQAPDFVAWRSQVSVVEVEELEIGDVELAREAVLIDALTQLDDEAFELTIVPELDVELAGGERIPLLAWWRAHGAACLAVEAIDSTLVHWCAWQAARNTDSQPEASVPVLLSRLMLMLARGCIATSEVERRVHRGLREACASGVLREILDVRLARDRHERWVRGLGGNRSLAWVEGADTKIAALHDAQMELVCAAWLAKRPWYERARWQRAVAEIMAYFHEEMRDWKVVRALLEYFAHDGIGEAFETLGYAGWRRAAIESARRKVGSNKWETVPEPSMAALDTLVSNIARVDAGMVGRALLELARREAERPWSINMQFIELCVTIFRSCELWPDLVDALTYKCASNVDFVVLEIESGREAVAIAHEHLPGDSLRLGAALTALASELQIARRPDEALDCLTEAALLIRPIAERFPDHEPCLIDIITATAACLSDLGRMSDATALQLEALERMRVRMSPDSEPIEEAVNDYLIMLHDAGRIDEAIEICRRESMARFARLRGMGRIASAASELASLGEYLHRVGKTEDAVTHGLEAITLMRLTGDVRQMILMLEWVSAWLWILDRHDEAFAALDECIALLHTAILDYGGRYHTVLGNSLLRLGTYLAELARPGAREAIEQAIGVYESETPTPNVASLATALEVLGDLTSTSDPQAARAAYARALELAHALPSRGEALPRALEHKLRALADA